MLKALFLLWKTSLRQQWLIYFIALAVFALGLAIGFGGVEKLPSDQNELLLTEVDGFLQRAAQLEIDFSLAIKESLSKNLILVGAIYLLGFTVIGLPFILIILFARGFALGFAVDFLIREKSGQGAVLALAGILPQNIIYVPALLIAAVAAISFTWVLIKRFQNSKVQVWPSLVAYSVIMVLVTACFVSATLVEVYLTPLLLKITAGSMF